MKKIIQKLTLGFSAILITTSVSAQCPTISCPGDITVNTDAGICGAVVNYSTPVGTDACATIGNFLFVSDNAGGTEIPAALIAEGHTVTTVYSDYVSANNATLQGALAAYDAVFWNAVGPGSGGAHSAATFTNLTNYVTAGGNIFVTGYDVISSPNDPNLISFLGGTSQTDSNAGNNVTIGSNSLTTGFSNIVGMTITPIYSDQDNLHGLSVSTVLVLEGQPGGAEWSINTIGSGEAAWVSSGQSNTNSMVAWTTIGSGYHEALLNFAATHVGGQAVTTMIAGMADGSTFPVGTTVVTYEVVDFNGANPASCSFNVTVVNPVELNVTLTVATLNSDAVGATYQWLDCDNGNAIIAGETNQAYTPSAVTGNYAVEISQNNCVDTSTCTQVDYTSVEEVGSTELVNIYPNPVSNGVVNVMVAGEITKLQVIDMSGRVIDVPNNIKEGIINVSTIESGKYLIQITYDDKVITRQIVVE